MGSSAHWLGRRWANVDRLVGPEFRECEKGSRRHGVNIGARRRPPVAEKLEGEGNVSQARMYEEVT